MSLATLRTRLQTDAQIQSSETDFSSSKLDELLTLALAQHNSTTLSSYTFDTLPSGQDELVKILAHIKVCLIRASGFVNTSDLTGSSSGSAGGYGQDRTTPYTKNMDMAKQLQKTYIDLISTGATDNQQIVVGRLVRKADEGDYEVPYALSLPIPIALSYSALTSTSVILSWTIPVTDKFSRYYLFSSEISDIRQEWNLTDVSETYPVPQISADATKIFETTDIEEKSVKVTGLTPGASINFLVVTKSLSDKYGYSNEVSLVMLASEAPDITSSLNVFATVGTPFSYQIIASGGTITGYGASGLPAGLSINTATGLITGTPTTSGVTSASVWATNEAGTTTETLVISTSVCDDHAVTSISTTTVLTSELHVLASGTITLTLPLSSARYLSPIIIDNVGVGNVTLQRQGSDTIEGATSFVLYPGESVNLTPNGSTLWTID